jgi:hypothetical protein
VATGLQGAHGRVQRSLRRVEIRGLLWSWQLSSRSRSICDFGSGLCKFPAARRRHNDVRDARFAAGFAGRMLIARNLAPSVRERGG